MNGNRLVGVVALALLIQSPAIAEDLKKLNLDDLGSVGLTITSDPTVKTEGAAAIKITTMWPTTVCLGEVTGVDIEDASLVFNAMVKTELEGEAYLEMWVNVSGGQYFSRGQANPAKGTIDWMPLQTPFVFQKGQSPDKLTLNIVINGKGTVWVDDITLSKEIPK